MEPESQLAIRSQPLRRHHSPKSHERHRQGSFQHRSDRRSSTKKNVFVVFHGKNVAFLSFREAQMTDEKRFNTVTVATAGVPVNTRGAIVLVMDVSPSNRFSFGILEFSKILKSQINETSGGPAGHSSTMRKSSNSNNTLKKVESSRSHSSAFIIIIITSISQSVI